MPCVGRGVQDTLGVALLRYGVVRRTGAPSGHPSEGDYGHGRDNGFPGADPRRLLLRLDGRSVRADGVRRVRRDLLAATGPGDIRRRGAAAPAWRAVLGLDLA